MNREEIALQLTLKSLEKFRVERASQVAEIFNVIHGALRLPEDGQSSPAEQAGNGGPAEQPAESKPEPPKEQLPEQQDVKAAKKGKRTSR